MDKYGKILVNMYDRDQTIECILIKLGDHHSIKYVAHYDRMDLIDF